MKMTPIKPGTYIVAVSGGIDSVVLLDMMIKLSEVKIIVAHFDHGIRPMSHLDAEFVATLCQKYGAEYAFERANLGEDASEETARTARYVYLQKIKKDYQADAIITAHHADDVIETIIINIIRGTGWRGLSALRSDDGLIRPLLHSSKQDIREYAKLHQLVWQEDETNKDTRYLRNYVRLTIVPKLTDDAKHALLTLHDNQVSLLMTIQAEIDMILEEALADSQSEYSRYFFITTHRLVAYEVLKSLTGATRPQLEKTLVAVKTAKAHSRHQVGGGVELHFTKSTFIVVRPDIVVS